MRLVFAGTPQIAADSLAELSKVHDIALVLTRPDAPLGRKQIITPSPVAQLAESKGFPVWKTNRIDAEAIEKLREAHAERAIVVAFGALIPQPALDLYPWWNLHFSLLPQWRGATPLQHSMMHGTGSGITVFELEAGLDTGPIIASVPVEVAVTEIASEALNRFTQLGTSLMLQALENLPIPRKQEGEVSYAPKLSRSEARIDFSSPAEQIARMINALNPEPAAWAELEEVPVKLLRAKPLGNIDWSSVSATLNPGAVSFDGNRVLVGAANGTQFELLEVQPAGKKPMAAGDWFRGQAKAVKFD